MNQAAGNLLARIESGEIVIGVIGLGYVGLPLALAFAETGSTVLGFDTDPEKTLKINAGESYISYLDSDHLRHQVRRGRLSATGELARLAEVDAVFICVPTPLGPSGDPDLHYVEETGRRLSRTLRPGQLVILESTTYPGTTEDVLRPVLEASGLRAGEDFFLAYSPEREDPANQKFRTRDIPRIVGGTDPLSSQLAKSLLERIVNQVFEVSDTRVAEASKLTENIFRAVNIALVNELKVVFDRMGIDVWDVLDAADTKPFGYMRFNPGPGWGGHCIPIDPFYLSWRAKQDGIESRFIDLAGRVNVEMPHWVIEKLCRALEAQAKVLAGSRIMVIGIAYKADVADPRESPAFEILSLLHRSGAEIAYHDPLIASSPAMRSWPDLPALDSEPLSQETLNACDAVILVTHHAAIDRELLLEHAPLIIDTRGVFRHPNEKVVRA
jgi:UDP-N-acetyl-D-glucosamine dehydrogenase